jgi:anti-sigma factor ChrR (cupin superfamily)
MKIDLNSLDWKKFRDGASIKSLANEGIQVDLVKLEPNVQFDEHVHAEAEWMYVLSGEFSDEEGVYSKGNFVSNKKDSRHATKSGKEGCSILVIKLEKS